MGDYAEVWHGKPFGSEEVVTVAVRSEWWALNDLYKLATGRCKYTVQKIRRDNKGHRRNRW